MLLLLRLQLLGTLQLVEYLPKHLVLLLLRDGMMQGLLLFISTVSTSGLFLGCAHIHHE